MFSVTSISKPKSKSDFTFSTYLMFVNEKDALCPLSLCNKSKIYIYNALLFCVILIILQCNQ